MATHNAPCGCGDPHPPAAVDDPRARTYADAEQRLGRKLHPGERHIDIEGYDRDLALGKARLHRAIEAERNRAIKLHLAGRAGWRMRVTEEMVLALEALYRAGERHARAEMKSMGYPTSYAERPRVGKLFRALLTHLASMLGGIGFRIQREAPVLKAQLDAGNLKTDVTSISGLQNVLFKAMEKRVPGSLDVASRLVSSAIAQGLGDTYREIALDAPCWVYTAVMDGATCASCKALDGSVYDTWDEIMVVLPGGGPNPKCLGDGRCRCRVVPCPPGR